MSACAAVLFISFFLPWVTFLGARLSGFDIAKNVSSYQFIWAMPLSALLIFLLNVARLNIAAFCCIVGLCPFAVLAYALTQLGGDLFQSLEVGAWLSLISGAMLAFVPSRCKPTDPI